MESKRERERRRRAGEARDAVRKRLREKARRHFALGERRLHGPQVPKFRDVLHEFGIKRHRPSPERDLILAIHRHRPELLDSRHRDLIDLLRLVPWNRNPLDWRPRHRAVDAAMKELLRHLFAVYPVPAFLIHTALESPKERYQALPLLRDLGRGMPLRDFTPNYHGRWRLTRRMRHLFIHTPPTWGYESGIRRATVLALGGDAVLARMIEDSDFLYFVDEEETDYAYALVRWLIRHAPFTPEELDRLDDEVWRIRREDRAWSPAGRSPRALLAAAERRRREERRIDRSIPERFPSSGLRPGAWRLPIWGRPRGEEWTMMEILSRKALVAEGTAMRHCVAGYAEDAAGPDTSLWSLRRDNRRRLTVQVQRDDLTADGSVRFRIMHASGKANRDPRPEELSLLARWTLANGMEPYERLGEDGLLG